MYNQIVKSAAFPDQRIFTLYCFLNISGYDEENNQAGMHPIRQALRADLASGINPGKLKSWQDFYQTHYGPGKSHLYSFNQYALNLTQPPELKSLNEASYPKLAGLSSVLQSVYKEINLEKLWEKYLTAHLAEAKKYEPNLDHLLNLVIDYIKPKEEHLPTKVIVVPNLLESYYRGKSILVDDNLYIIEGPHRNDKPNIDGVIHEFIHAAINPVLQHNETEIAEHSSLFEGVEKTKQIVASYNNWQAYFSECLTRALTLRISANDLKMPAEIVEKSLSNLDTQGFKLSRSLYSLFDDYEKDGQTFEDYFPQLLVKI